MFGQLSFLIIPFGPNLVFCDDPFVNYEYSGARHDFPVENWSLNSLKAGARRTSHVSGVRNTCRASLMLPRTVI